MLRFFSHFEFVVYFHLLLSLILLISPSDSESTIKKPKNVYIHTVPQLNIKNYFRFSWAFFLFTKKKSHSHLFLVFLIPFFVHFSILLSSYYFNLIMSSDFQLIFSQLFFRCFSLFDNKFQNSFFSALTTSLLIIFHAHHTEKKNQISSHTV